VYSINSEGLHGAKVGIEDVLKPAVGIESLHEVINDIVFIVVNLATSESVTVKSTMFPHCNIHKYTWTSPDAVTLITACFRHFQMKYRSRL
jgi:hypothetical protein